MTTDQENANAEPAEDAPFESVPELSANADFIAKMDRLRELKELKDSLFNDDEKRGPLGEFEALKRECAALAAVAGCKSIVYYDLRVGTTDGGYTKGGVTGEGLIDLLTAKYGTPTAAQFIAIAHSAKSCDIQALADRGISPIDIAAAKSPDKPRAGSIRVEWVGRKGRGAQSKMKGGSLQ